MNSEELRQRTVRFAIQVMAFVRLLPKGLEGQVIGRQLFRSATSVAANYRAARRARSKREFYAKLCIVVEETDESLFWLEFTREGEIASNTDLEQEATELLYIFSASRKTAGLKLE